MTAATLRRRNWGSGPFERRPPLEHPRRGDSIFSAPNITLSVRTCRAGNRTRASESLWLRFNRPPSGRSLTTATDAHVRPAAIAALWPVDGDLAQVMPLLLVLPDDQITFQIGDAAARMIAGRSPGAVPRSVITRLIRRLTGAMPTATRNTSGSMLERKPTATPSASSS